MSTSGDGQQQAPQAIIAKHGIMRVDGRKDMLGYCQGLSFGERDVERDAMLPLCELEDGIDVWYTIGQALLDAWD